MPAAECTAACGPPAAPTFHHAAALQVGQVGGPGLEAVENVGGLPCWAAMGTRP